MAYMAEGSRVESVGVSIVTELFEEEELERLQPGISLLRNTQLERAYDIDYRETTK